MPSPASSILGEALELGYVPDHVLVKFHSGAARRIDAASLLSRETGLPSIDALHHTVDVRDVTRTFESLGRLDPDGSVGLARWHPIEVRRKDENFSHPRGPGNGEDVTANSTRECRSLQDDR